MLLPLLRGAASVGLVLGASLCTQAAAAADVSLISGVFKKEEAKVDGAKAGSSSVIEAGGRFGQMIGGNIGWFAQGLLALKSYDAPAGKPDLDDSTSLSAGGGIRFVGKRWNEFAIPYLWGMGEYRSAKSADVATATEVEENGLYYSGGVGIRLAVDADFFVDLESPFFTSALFATEKTTVKSIDATGKEQKSETKRSKTELYGRSQGPLNGMILGLGIKL